MRQTRPIVRIIVAFMFALGVVSSFTNLAVAKGPILTQAPITIGLYVPSDTPELASQSQASSLSSVILDIPHLYNSSWRPAIADLAARSSKSLGGVWLDSIRLEQDQPLSNGTSSLHVIFGAVVNGSELDFGYSYPPDPELAKHLKILGASLWVGISVFGPDFNPTFMNEFFSQADTYFSGFNSLAGQISQTVLSQFPGKYFGSLSLSILDKLSVRLDTSLATPTIYFGSNLRTELVTATVTSTIPGSDSANSVAAYANYAFGGLGIASLGGALLVFLISRRGMS